MTQQTYIMLTAEDGKILTNGETFGRIVSLGNGDVPENWREVDEAEYTAYLEAEEAKAAAAGVPPVENGDGTPASAELQWSIASQKTGVPLTEIAYNVVHGDSTATSGTPEEDKSDGT